MTHDAPPAGHAPKLPTLTSQAEKTVSADKSRQNATAGSFATEIGHAKKASPRPLAAKIGQKPEKSPEKSRKRPIIREFFRQHQMKDEG
jgi:hypothetical protein